MRAKGKKYLPQFPYETTEAYEARRESSWLFNGVNKAIEDATGKVFGKPVALKTPEGNPLDDMMSDVDMEGRDLSNFAMDVFTGGIRRGLSFIMVDAPRREEELTVGQAREMGMRPSMSYLPLDNVLGWQWKNIHNAPMLVQFRSMEEVEDEDRDEFSDETVQQIRVQDLVDGFVRVRLYRNATTTGTGRESGFQLADEYTTDQTKIMVVPFYTERTGYLKAVSPIQDLTEINLAHWRSQSDQANIMHHARAPMKYFHGYSSADLAALVEGPGNAFINSNEAASVGVVEHSGAAITAGRVELKDMEFQMQAMGLQLLISKTGNNTATGDAIDESKQNSRLSIWADNLKDALETAIGWMADLAGVTAETEVFVNKEYTALSHLTMDQVRDMYAASVISKRTYIAEARRRGVLDEAVDADDEADLMEQEGGDFVDVPDVEGVNGNAV